jgi:hypothetical protein
MRLLTATLLATLALPAASAAPAGEWAVVASPNSSFTRTSNYLTATTCATPADCWAVGYYNGTVATLQTLIERWDGTRWATVPSPNTGVTQGNVLRAVTCVSASDCWAVGSWSEPASPSRTLALHWDGTAWSIVPTPNTGDGDYNYLAGVACAGPAACSAVGYRSTPQGFQTLALRWDGTAWSIVASPNGSGAQQSFLDAVTCGAAGDCWAVGWYVQGTTGFNQTLVLRWNGTAWAAVGSPNALLSTHNDLHGVACAAANDCWAVGAAYNGRAQQTLALRWNGTAWSVVTSPSSAATADNTLRAVSCSSASDCWAVGNRAAGAAQTLALRWNGSAWALVASPSPDAGRDATLWGVHCPGGGGACWAAGSHDDAGVRQTLALRWDGAAWGIADSADHTAPQNNTLLGVDCVAADDCWAVASYSRDGVQQTLVQHWDGAAWGIVASPNTSPAQSNILYDVACVATDDCWVAGYFLGDTGWQTLTLHWDGAAWTIVPSPSAAGGNNFLTDIACVAADDCWAVGFRDAGVYQTLILRWNGTAWSLVESPNTDLASENRLSGIACVAADDCWAVGLHKVDGFLQRTLVARWDGAAWSLVASPNVGEGRNNVLEDVACESASACWAVGAWSPGAAGTGQPLILRWDGGAWTAAEAPQGPNLNNFLRGVTCAAAADCWAVGDVFLDGYARTLVQHWDGNAWSTVPSPNTGAAQASRLVGVSCATPRDCRSVGYSTSEAGVFRTLALHYAAPAPAEPDAFGFLLRGGVATAAWITSEAVRLAGYDGTLPVTVAGGQYRLDDGPWTAAPGQVAAGSLLRVRHLSADGPEARTTTTVAVGTFGAEFASVTSAADRTPEPFGFASQSGVVPGADVESEVIVPHGFNVGIALQPGPGLAYRVAGGDWTTSPGTLQPGQSLQVRHAASGTSRAYTRTYLKAGGVTGYFTTRTR